MTETELREKITANQERFTQQLNNCTADIARLRKLRQRLELDLAMQQGALDTLNILEAESMEREGG